jgi:HEAT repeat protein
LKEILAKGDVAERVAVINLLGDEALRLRYPSGTLIPDYLTLLHPEVPFLARIANDANAAVELRVAAVLALGKTNGDAKEVVPPLAKVLGERQNPVALRLAAVEALGRPVNRLLQAYTTVTAGKTSPEKEESTRVLRVVVREGAPYIWPALVGGLQDPSPQVRRASAYAAKDFSSTFLEFALIATARTSDFDYAPLLKVFREQMPKLDAALNDPDPVVRRLGLSVVEDLAAARLRLAAAPAAEAPIKPPAKGPVAAQEGGKPEILPAGLQAAAKDPPADVPDLSAALKASLPALVKALRNRDPDTRLAAAHALEAIGEDTAAFLPDLTAALSDSYRFVRWTMLRTLGRLAPREPKVVVAAVVPLVGDPDIDVRMAALKVLGAYGKEAAGMGAGAAIAKLLPRDDASVQVAALQALQAIGEWDRPTLAVVADLLQVDDANVRVSAADTLGRAGPKAAPFRPAVERAMEASEEKVRSAASEALLRIGK